MVGAEEVCVAVCSTGVVVDEARPIVCDVTADPGHIL